MKDRRRGQKAEPPAASKPSPDGYCLIAHKDMLLNHEMVFSPGIRVLYTPQKHAPRKRLH
jgi:hypothetical protein